MQRFFTALSVTVTMAMVQSVAYAQTAEMNSELALNMPVVQDVELEATALSAQPLLERTANSDDLIPPVEERRWNVELLPSFSTDSGCSAPSAGIMLICIVSD